MKQWSYRRPLFALGVSLLASLIATGCAESKTRGGETEDVASQEKAGGPTEVLGNLDAEDAYDLAQITLGNRPDFAPIDLVYSGLNDDCKGESPGQTCVGAYPATATVWKEAGKNQGKPKKARWWIGNAQKDLYYWEIVYKGPDGQDWLGTIKAIDCNSKKTKSTNVAHTVEPGMNLDWPYQITVWKCKDGNKDPNDCLCKTDPMIQIHD